CFVILQTFILQHFYYITSSYLLQCFVILQTFIITIFLLYYKLLFITDFYYYNFIILQALIYYSVLLYYRLLLLQYFYYITSSYLSQCFIILQTFIITAFYYFNFITII
ncbi:hypothetical protein EPL71_15920, partial [Clostridioides difficile]|nr:hypothetical protein [Clostridioides difficile]